MTFTDAAAEVLRLIGRNEVGTQHAFGRAGLFDLCNHSRLACVYFLAQCAHKVAGQHTRLGVFTNHGQRFAFDGVGDFFALDGHYLVEDVGHGSGCQFLCD